jgi:hypothetical protein
VQCDSGDDIADALDRLHSAGWSIGDTASFDIKRSGTMLPYRPREAISPRGQDLFSVEPEPGLGF